MTVTGQPYPIRIPTSVSCLAFFAAGDDKANVWLKDAELGWVHARTREAVLKIREITTGVDMMNGVYSLNES